MPGHVRLLWIGLLALSTSGATVVPPAHPTRDLLTGLWQGSAVFQGARLEFRVRLFMEGAVVRATMSSPDLLMLEQPLDAVKAVGRQLSFTTPDEHPLRFEGV